MSRNEWVTIVAAIVVVVIISAGLWFYFRQRFVRMAEKVEDAIDAIIDGRELKTEELNKDTLFSKIQSKLEQLSEVTKSAEEKNVKQKEEMQKMVSDISHQLKTPIANITMYNDTILNHDLPANNSTGSENNAKASGKAGFSCALTDENVSFGEQHDQAEKRGEQSL